MPLDVLTNTFAGYPLDRASDRRTDGAWIAARLDSHGSRAVALWNGQPMIAAEGEPRLVYFAALLAKEIAAGDERLLFLGLQEDGAAVFALDLEGPADPSAGTLKDLGQFSELRGVSGWLPGADAAIAATARAVFEWRRRHRFCSACGKPSQVADAGWKRICPACSTEHFPRTDPAVIMLPVQGERCLLGRQARWPPGMHSTLAGFVEPGETFEEACARELREEAGLEALRVRYHSCQPWPFPCNLMIGLIAEVAEGDGRPDQTELEAVRWFSREDARALLNGEMDGVSCPPPFAIAHQLIRTWANG